MPAVADPRRGEVWPVSQPGDPHAPRPCLVISENDRNQHAATVLIVPIQTAAAPGPTRIPLRAGQGGVQHDSVLMGDDITRVRKAWLGARPYGSITVDVLKKVLVAIRIACGDPTA